MKYNYEYPYVIILSHKYCEIKHYLVEDNVDRTIASMAILEQVKEYYTDSHRSICDTLDSFCNEMLGCDYETYAKILSTAPKSMRMFQSYDLASIQQRVKENIEYNALIDLIQAILHGDESPARAYEVIEQLPEVSIYPLIKSRQV